jgi:prepilin-type N-terminal cleavage/methylation domain-containing protein
MKKCGSLKSTKTKRGFTLLEIAIVTGIVGAILAALFAAATTVEYRVSLNQASDDINLIAGNVRSYYAGQNTSFSALAPPAAVTTTSFCTYTIRFLADNIFPSDMVTKTGAVSLSNHPWSQTTTTCGASAIGSVNVSLVGTANNPVQFVIRFVNVPAEACTDLITRNSLPGRDTGLTQIQVQPSGAAAAPAPITQLPISPTAAATACAGSGVAAGTLYTIDWYYNVGS